MNISGDISGIGASQNALRNTEALRSTFQNFASQLQSAISLLEGGEDADVLVSGDLKSTAEKVASVFDQLVASLSGQSAVLANETQPNELTNEVPVSAKQLQAESGALPTMTERLFVTNQGHTSTTLAPGEQGAGLPSNYLKSPLYQEWLDKQPVMGSNVAEYGQALSAWQESNPFYVNPKNYETFDNYLVAVTNSTASGNTAAENDPARMQSFLASYYQTAALANPWGSALGNISNEVISKWPDSVQALYRQTLEAENSRAAHKILIAIK